MAETLLSSEGLTPQLTPNFFNTRDYQIQMKENFIIVFEKSSFLGEGFELIAESVSLPERQFAKIEVPYANKNINLAGRNSFSDMRIVVRDVISADTSIGTLRYMSKYLFYEPEKYSIDAFDRGSTVTKKNTIFMLF